MTVIAYDGKILAADGLSSDGCRVFSKSTKKIFPFLNISHHPVALVAMSGDACDEAPFLAWLPKVLYFDSGIKQYVLHTACIAPDVVAAFPHLDDSTNALVVINGTAWMYICNAYPIEVPTPFAMGSGRDEARAAMYCGKDAISAVRLSCEMNTSCGGIIEAWDVSALKIIKPRDYPEFDLT